MFGRLNLIGQYNDKRQFVLKSLRSNAYIEIRKSLWSFFDVTDLSIAEPTVTGLLVKLRPEDREVGDMEKHELATTVIPNAAIAKSRFFLALKSGLIAYQHCGSAISPTAFRLRFSELFKAGHGNFFVEASILSVDTRFSFNDMLRRFERIDEISISLRPTNPNYDHIYRLHDERLKRLRAAEYSEKLVGSPSGSGLNLSEDDEIRSKAVMAEDGYGQVSAFGLLEGKKMRVSTSEHPISQEAITDNKTPEQIHEQLQPTFRDIEARKAHDQ